MLIDADSRTEHTIEHLWRGKRKNRTIDDLLNIPLEGTKPIKCVVDPYTVGPGMTDDKVWKAWVLLNAYSPKGKHDAYGPTLDTLGKRLRWKLYTTLLKWGVI